MAMNKRTILGLVFFLLFVSIVLLSVSSSRNFIFHFVDEARLFIKEHLFSIFAAFFLVKGKFILMVFLKKVFFLSATGLGKRYLIEKVITHNIKIHFLDYISHDIKRLLVYIKKNFKTFPLVKQIIAGFVFLSSLGFVGKFMGSMLAMKVFIAKVWSFLLAWVLKLGTAVIYFFTDYMWDSWLAPIVEIVIFSWLVSWLEKVPYLKKVFMRIAHFFSGSITKIDFLLNKIFHLPTKKFFKYLATKIKNIIYRFIQYERLPAWHRLQEVRKLVPNKREVLIQKRRSNLNSRNILLAKRRTRARAR
ncbi:MAG: Unknown protein [uncultured Sulfurovum sp.]|uniref:Uncharacterized protein n=1 Tax=uncultured Sulfurovum sp. TaxID=269237 RepID=A0A6S6SJV7_9BACT|nr:MAG: Unknown protein [uncultured Sulfurovum sp.]